MAVSAREALTIDPTIFRAYDIRGIVDENLTETIVCQIGKALGSLLHSQAEKTVYVARDGRLSGPRLMSALVKGLLSTGCTIIQLGMVPTPLLYYAAHYSGESAGIMLTGSHNPKDYNGLKVMLKGKSLTEHGIQSLYQRILQQDFVEASGSHEELNIIDSYHHHLLNNIQLARPLQVVIDAGNGVAGLLAPALYRALGCQVKELYCDIDGRFPNHHPDPSDPRNLQALIHAVDATKADIGLAFDGDGDRLGVVTSSGNIIFPDRLLMLFATYLLKQQPKATIVYDVKCTHHLTQLIQSLGGNGVMWKTGHSFIKQKMLETSAQLGGEMSGHLFFKDRWYGFDDALYAGARLLEILSQEEKISDAIFNTIPNSINTPELKIAVQEAEKFKLIETLTQEAHFPEAQDILTIDGLRVNFKEGWGLIRASNTTPYLIARFEAINQTVLQHIQFKFREWLLSVKPDLALPF